METLGAIMFFGGLISIALAFANVDKDWGLGAVCGGLLLLAASILPFAIAEGRRINELRQKCEAAGGQLITGKRVKPVCVKLENVIQLEEATSVEQ